MTDYYLDASAVVKRYADEPGSTWIRQITDPQPQNTILLTEITLAPLIFVAADGDLLTAAAAERLSVENPLNHTHLDS